jgi:hypothetical protein
LSFGRPIFLVDVYLDGSLTGTHFDVQSSFDSAFPGQFLAFGLPSTTSFGAVDIDFYSYRLGVVAPVVLVPIPAVGPLGLWLVAAALMAVGVRSTDAIPSRDSRIGRPAPGGSARSA